MSIERFKSRSCVYQNSAADNAGQAITHDRCKTLNLPLCPAKRPDRTAHILDHQSPALARGRYRPYHTIVSNLSLLLTSKRTWSKTDYCPLLLLFGSMDPMSSPLRLRPSYPLPPSAGPGPGPGPDPGPYPCTSRPIGPSSRDGRP